MIHLSKNFTLEELTKSQTALRNGLDNTPNEAQIDNLRFVAQIILQPVRDMFGVGFAPSSTFRSTIVNRLSGSSDVSQHRLGEATDFEVPGVSNLTVANWMKSNLEFDQLILEFHTPGDPNSGWIHCSVKRIGDNRHQVLTAKLVDGQVVYNLGIDN